MMSGVILKLNTPVTYVFGNKTNIDCENPAVMPRIINDRTLVPVRFIAESLGDTKLSVNDQVKTLDVPAQSIEGRTMLPLRAVTESLGMKVFWDNRGLIVVSSSDVLSSEDAEFIDEILKKFN